VTEEITIIMDTNNTAGPWYEMRSTRLTHARYDAVQEEVHVIFRDGTPWTYYGVEPDVWLAFLTSESPGLFIHLVLDDYPYSRDEHDLLGNEVLTIDGLFEFLEATEPPEAA